MESTFFRKGDRQGDRKRKEGMKLIFRTVGWHAMGVNGDRSYAVEGDEENGYNAINTKSGKSEQLDGGPFETLDLAVARCQEDEDARAKPRKTLVPRTHRSPQIRSSRVQAAIPSLEFYEGKRVWSQRPIRRHRQTIVLAATRLPETQCCSCRIDDDT